MIRLCGGVGIGSDTVLAAVPFDELIPNGHDRITRETE